MISFAESGEPGLLILAVPAEFSAIAGDSECFAIPVMSRRHGLLLCIPRGVISEDVLIDCLTGEDSAHPIGPSKGIPVQLQEESDEQEVIPVPGTVGVFLVDFSDDVLAWMREYDPNVDAADTIMSYSTEHPFAMPVVSQLVPIAQEWISSQGSDRVNFYSALEEQEPTPIFKANAKGVGKPKQSQPKRVTNAQMMEQMEVMVAQMKALAARTDMLEQAKDGGAKAAGDLGGGNISGVPAVSAGLAPQAAPSAAFAKYTALVGPPPKVKQVSPVAQKPAPPVPFEANVAEDPSSLAQALSQQSSAVLALVSHLANQSDPLADIPGVSPHSTSIKGVQKREKMQQDLAMGSSSYYLQVMQQLHKKLHPSLPLPKTVDELQHLSVLTYLERTGGFKNNRDAGLLMWLLGYVVDAAAQGDLHQVRERLALMMVSLEQSVIDGDWTIAFLLSLAEDPPISLFMDKTSTLAPFGKPFSNLVPPQWASVVLSFVKEMEVLQNKKPESPKKSPKNPDPENPSPRRKPRFPKKPMQEDPAKGQ